MKDVEILNEIFTEMNILQEEYKQITYYYVYAIFFPNCKFYIGSRQCNCIPIEDKKYTGSYTDKSNGDGIKVILKIFSNENEMTFYETNLIQKFKSYSNCINVNSSPRVCNNNKLNSKVFKTTDLMQIYGYSSSTTLSNWCIIAEIDRFRQGKYFYVSNEDKLKLDEVSNFIKSGYTYEDYLKTKGKSKEEIKSIISKVKGLNYDK
jgi:hypothetical protein